MITSLYAPTRGIDFVGVTCVTDAPAPVRLGREDEEQVQWVDAPSAPVRGGNRWFWRFTLTGLPAGTRHRLVAQQGTQLEKSLSVATLAHPGGARRLRLGIVADPHCTEQRPSTGSKRYAQSYELLADALEHLAQLGADAIIIAGDLTDDGTSTQIQRARRLLQQSAVPVYPIIGNHDRHADRFLQAFDLDFGYRSIDIGGVHLVLLHTQSVGDLAPQSAQLRWLRTTLAEHTEADTLVFSHYPLVDHPYLVRESSRCIHNWRAVAALLGRQRRVRAAFAGHKNIPSRTMVDGVPHIVCPQPLRVPCGYDVVDVYEGGLTRTVHEVRSLPLIAEARAAVDREELHYRYGLESGRNFALQFDAADGSRALMPAGSGNAAAL